MKRLSRFQRRADHQRHGAAHVLIAAMLFTFVMVAAMTVDFAYMQLIRTELRTATDAAAKAGAEALARTQDGNAAKAAAVQYAGLNKVGGRAYAITTNDVTLGRVTGQTNGTWTFTANATPFNSVRVNAKIGNGGVTPAMNMFFAPALGHAPFSTAAQATAGQQEVEVCLCIDRSGSMMFDMTGNDWSYPSPNPLLYSSGFYPNSMFRNYCSPPQTTASRWAIMRSAVNIFLDEAGQFQYPPRTALVTWSSAMTLPYHPYTSYTLVDTDHNLPAAGSFVWSTNRTAIENVIATRSNSAIGGGTTLSAGLDRAVAVLTGANGRALSSGMMGETQFLLHRMPLRPG
jgi:Flp pilus assembly protein TadG